MSEQQKPTTAVQQNSLQNKPNTTQPQKKTHSYTYWVDQKNKSRQLPPQQRPKKIEAPIITTKTSEEGRSQWNTAGTWQHKAISLKQVQKQYTEKINQWVSENYPQAKVKKVSLNGECEIVFIRNKRALTYEINGKVEFQKKLQQQKEQEQKSQTQPQKPVNEDISSGEQISSNKDSDDSNVEKQKKSSPKIKSKNKPKTMTFEIVDLTDSGDREFKSKADDNQDKKFITSKSDQLLKILEEILKSYK